MKAHINIRGKYSELKPAINLLDEIARYREGGRSVDVDCDDVVADYFYDDYDLAEIDYERIVDDDNKDQIKIEEW